MLVQEFDASFLGTLIVDATISVLSPSGFSRVLDVVGQSGKSATLATTIGPQFLVYVLLWACGTQYVEARDGWRQHLPFAAIQVGAGFALFVIAAAILDFAAASSVFDAGDWGNYLWQTLVSTTLFVVVAHGLDRFAAARSGPAFEPSEPDGAPSEDIAVIPCPDPQLIGRQESRRGFLALAGELGVFVTAAVFAGRVVAETTETGVRRTFRGMLPPSVKPNDAFYTVSKNFSDPVVDGDSWRLRIDGLVETPQVYTLDEVKLFPTEGSMNTLMCISYELGDEFISNAR